MANKLTSYQSPNESFYAKQDEFNDNEYLIEDGEELIYDEINEIDDDELLEWAEGDELLSEEEGHLLDDGKVNYDSLREAWISYKKREQEENPSSYFYPSGRAFIWFDGQNFNFPKDIKANEKILVNDGKLILKVLETNNKNLVKAKVLQGGPLESRKGVNLPNTNISLPALTTKDKEDALFAIKQEVDWIALSFVRSKKDITELEKLIAENSSYKIPIIAKIEKPEAIENMDGIIKKADGIMVARGDLGLEIPSEEVPLNQKLLVSKAKKARKPIIIATQMMESMIDSLTPSRAEVNDVANSIMDGADAVMLSGETSVGKFPVEVVNTMEKIIRKVEDSPLIKSPFVVPGKKAKRIITKSVCFHAASIANELNASAICTLTNSGYTGWQISSLRPNSIILVFTSNKRILSQLNLLWGVKCLYYNHFVSTDATIEEVNQMALNNGFIKKNDLVINLSAMPIVEKGEVNTLRISKI